MIGKEEGVTTYTEFMLDTKGELIFHYLYGRSRSGYEIFNLWDANNKK